MASKLETERKFIIEKPDLERLAQMPEYTESSIVQIYISSQRGTTHRIRARKYKDRLELTETIKIRLSNMTAHESESQISKTRFEMLKRKMALDTSPVIKNRYTFKENGYKYEIDIYPYWKKTCILEVELTDESEKIPFPDIFRIIREVTGDKRYTNASMAREFPSEDLI